MTAAAWAARVARAAAKAAVVRVAARAMAEMEEVMVVVAMGGEVAVGRAAARRWRGGGGEGGGGEGGGEGGGGAGGGDGGEGGGDGGTIASAHICQLKTSTFTGGHSSVPCKGLELHRAITRVIVTLSPTSRGRPQLDARQSAESVNSRTLPTLPRIGL